ncbi:hypothetical protein IQ37_19720 [Chryseobacterium piperi]|uniref:C-type lectin domain-containing protein n=2 Tax=Chryseobacterium piperi TaxID=558152 RepID=A0A085ZZR7_9FLAO|nr:C-type lectin domain-containing protein [Chryseobacterium piperi]ASW74878.1 hypothetical protein CJF12_11690 [Chryseobacterium piperi]KFF09931.1 hypothetical protein IQ37_19720 [Chryseobacterium piperi]
MTKKILLFMVLPLAISAQVGINTLEPTKTFDINGELRVRTLNQGEPTDEILSVDSDGNVRRISRDEFGGGTSGFNSTILGYDPQPSANRPQPPGAVPGGGTATELGCKQRPENNHIYCAYQLTQPINWFNAFDFAKQMGGYLVTMPGDAERIWVNTNIVASGTGYDLNNSIWIGFNKIRRPGNPDQLQWITGEEFRINWSTNPATTENWFAPGEPNNSGQNEGATHILSGGERRWNDLAGTVTSSNNRAMDQLIVEFNE